MCKVLSIVGITPQNHRKAYAFMVNAKSAMIQGNPHGLGYAGITATGELFGERWLESKDGFLRRGVIESRDRALMNTLGVAADVKNDYSAFGNVDHENTCALILHSRFATCDHKIENTHPFVRDQAALIHNGVISNHSELKNHTSTCDSECILNEYVDSGAQLDATKIQHAVERLKGSFTCIVLNGQTVRPTVDVFRHSNPLVAAYAAREGFFVFATSELILRSAAKKTKIKLGSVIAVKEHHLLRLDAQTGEQLAVERFIVPQSSMILSSIHPSWSEYSVDEQLERAQREAAEDLKAGIHMNEVETMRMGYRQK